MKEMLALEPGQVGKEKWGGGGEEGRGEENAVNMKCS